MDIVCTDIVSMLIGLTPVWIVLLACLLYCAWEAYIDREINSIKWDGKPWDEAEYQRRVKEWEKEREEKKNKENEEKDSR